MTPEQEEVQRFVDGAYKSVRSCRNADKVFEMFAQHLEYELQAFKGGRITLKQTQSRVIKLKQLVAELADEVTRLADAKHREYNQFLKEEHKYVGVENGRTSERDN